MLLVSEKEMPEMAEMVPAVKYTMVFLKDPLFYPVQLGILL